MVDLQKEPGNQQIDRSKLQIAAWILQKDEPHTEWETAHMVDLQKVPGNQQIDRR
ncbi:hypothetical protein M3205_07865 [Cytobacillus firmus]|uniref:hypothetical protein n=1 Tax=Cytobacillus firmus TaxID=1399 RepID=UPI002041A0EC|nr:hypothetical protein [Cytobacillus firmus]MCM3705649.1 hypothetical protein [Cytobacillus firmus]